MFLKLSKDHLLSLNLILAFISCGIYLTQGMIIFLYLYIALGVSNFLILSNIKFKVKNLFLFLFFCLFFILEFNFFSNYYKQDFHYFSILVFLSCFGFAFNLIENKYKLIVSKILFISYIAFLFCIFLTKGILGAPGLNEVFFNSSRNVVSAVLILLFINYLISAYFNKVKISFFWFFIVIIFCIFLYGRTGITISIFLLLIDLVFRKKLSSVFFVIFTSIVFTAYIDELIIFLDNTSFSQGLESPRSDMRHEYLINIFNTPSNWIFGQNYYDCCKNVVAYNMNIHNSFLSGHAKFGIIHTLLSIFILILILLSRQPYLFFLGLVIYFRYFFDEIGLFNIYDVTLFYLVLVAIKFKRLTH